MSKFDISAAANRIAATALACESDLRRQGAEEFRARAVKMLKGVAKLAREDAETKSDVFMASSVTLAAKWVAALPLADEPARPEPEGK